MKPIVIENFINKEEKELLLDYFTKMNPKINKGVGYHWEISNESFISSQLVNDDNISKIVFKNYNKLKSTIEDNFNVKVELKIFYFQTMYEGAEIGIHSDVILNYNTNRSRNLYSAVVYLNDDYQGGELYFPNEDINFKPKPGSLVYFHSDSNSLHGVKKIESGQRSNWILFFKEVR